MDSTTDTLQDRFGGASRQVAPDVLGELQSILRLHGISPQELFYKWESYSIKMGAEETKLDLATTRDFKKDLHEALERESRGKHQVRSTEKRAVGATPRAGAGVGDVFGMMDGVVPNTPRPGALGKANGSTVKRKSNFETPAPKASKNYSTSTPNDPKTPVTTGTNGVNGSNDVSFASRPNAGQIQESLNGHIEIPSPSETAPSETRIKLKANTELSKYAYKTMAMKLSEASEILDDRIEEFLAEVQARHKLEESAFGNPSAQSTSEIVAVGRIASDSGEGRLNPASLVLEASRKTGAGLRVPLRVEQLQSYDFFPGKIVALRGMNASGDFFTVTEELSIPLLPPAASTAAELDVHNARVQGSSSDPDSMADSSSHPLNIIIAAGPYTQQTSLDFSAFHALLSTVLETRADGLILLGPFLDIEHPIIRTGAFELPDNYPVAPDQATLTDLFRYHISQPLIELASQLPSCQIIIVPDVRDTATKGAVSWPQDRFSRKELGLAGQKTIQCVTNPVTLSLNEAVWGMGSLDVLEQIRSAGCVGGKAKIENVFERACRGVISQKHFMPVFPPADRTALEEKKAKEEGEDADENAHMDWKSMGASLDVSYLKLGEWLNVRPDVLVTPSILTPFAKVIESVLCINPGTLSKKKAPGTYARVTVLPMDASEEERNAGGLLPHRMFDRARVDIIKI
ncbi:DNA polymerase alpha/epsilon subunit B [Rhizodiscina lignyota]|uniref:DNA polymerase alpha subunit B n=1 Tax=Rhizodiscina lignyota TaxID=1504668 RepID=A0A9P4MBI6_9PEZI|nr:DNA polymerase alpha/epsilon subunit B [Rhizodiscina lignyota]